MLTFSTIAIVIGIISGIIMGILTGICLTWCQVAKSNVLGEEDYNIDELNEAVTFHNKS